MWPTTNKVIKQPVTAMMYFLPSEEQNKLQKNLLINNAIPYAILFVQKLMICRGAVNKI